MLLLLTRYVFASLPLRTLGYCRSVLGRRTYRPILDSLVFFSPLLLLSPSPLLACRHFAPVLCSVVSHSSHPPLTCRPLDRRALKGLHFSPGYFFSPHFGAFFPLLIYL